MEIIWKLILVFARWFGVIWNRLCCLWILWVLNLWSLSIFIILSSNSWSLEMQIACSKNMRFSKSSDNLSSKPLTFLAVSQANSLKNIIFSLRSKATKKTKPQQLQLFFNISGLDFNITSLDAINLFRKKCLKKGRLCYLYMFDVFHVIDLIMNHELNLEGKKRVKLFSHINHLTPSK